MVKALLELLTCYSNLYTSIKSGRDAVIRYKMLIVRGSVNELWRSRYVLGRQLKNAGKDLGIVRTTRNEVELQCRVSGVVGWLAIRVQYLGF